MDLNRSASVGKEPLGVERSLNTASVKSRGLRGSLYSGAYSSASSHTAPLPSPLIPWQPMHNPRYTHSPCLSRVGFGGTGLPTGSMFPVAGRQIEYRIGVGWLAGPLPHHQAHPLRPTRPPAPPLLPRSPAPCSKPIAFLFTRDGRPDRRPSSNPERFAGQDCTDPNSKRTRGLFSGDRGPAPSPCWTSTCRLPAPSWPRCSHR